MSRRPSTRQLAFVIAAAVLYYWTVLVGVQLATSIPMPGWWGGGAPGALATYSWLQLTHGLGLFLVSAPFALGIGASRLQRPVFIAFAAAALGLVAPVAFRQDVAGLVDSPLHGQVLAALDFFKFIVTLPLITWLLARKAPSNNAFKPTPLGGPA